MIISKLPTRVVKGQRLKRVEMPDGVTSIRWRFQTKGKKYTVTRAAGSSTWRCVHTKSGTYKSCRSLEAAVSWAVNREYFGQ